MLNFKILSLNFFFVFFSLVMSKFRIIKAFVHLIISNRHSSRCNTTFFIKTIFKLILKIKIASLFNNFILKFRTNIILHWNKIMMIISLISMDNLISFSSFFSSKSKTHCRNSIRIIKIGSSSVWDIFRIQRLILSINFIVVVVYTSHMDMRNFHWLMNFVIKRFVILIYF